MYPIFKIYTPGVYEQKNPFIAIKFTGNAEGEVVFSENSIHPIGHKSNTWVAHTEKNSWRDPATRKEWLYFLPEPYKSQALKNLKNPDTVVKFDGTYEHSLGRVLMGAFGWYETEQGANYWCDLYKSLTEEKTQTQKQTEMKKKIYVTPSSVALIALLEELGQNRVTECDLASGYDYITYLEDSKVLESFDEHHLDGFEKVTLSRADFIKKIEELEEEEKREEFDWNEYECYVEDGHIQVGCQRISERDVAKFEALIKRYSPESEVITLDNGTDLEIESRELCDIEVCFNGGDDTFTLEDVKELVSLIKEAQSKL